MKNYRILSFLTLCDAAEFLWTSTGLLVRTGVCNSMFVRRRREKEGRVCCHVHVISLEVKGQHVGVAS